LFKRLNAPRLDLLREGCARVRCGIERLERSAGIAQLESGTAKLKGGQAGARIVGRELEKLDQQVFGFLRLRSFTGLLRALKQGGWLVGRLGARVRGAGRGGGVADGSLGGGGHGPGRVRR
jgi:hypothetical protein